MSRAPSLGDMIEKPAAGWFDGVNSFRTRWLLPDTQFVWGENTINRGGTITSRPGNKLLYSLPAGNLQGYKLYKPTKLNISTSEIYHHVFCVNGSVYAIPVGTIQPVSWEVYRLKNITFKPEAPYVAWCVAQKEVTSTTGGESLTLVPTYSVLMMQDGSSPAAYWDGEINGQTNENAPEYGTPTGLWMSFAGDRLWVARGNTAIAGDLLDPLKFTERNVGLGRGDYRFNDTINGFAQTSGEARQSNLLVFTSEQTTSLLASILDRDLWQTTPNFRSVLFPNLGCVAGRSIVTHAGLLWWYSPNGLANSDSASISFITSQIKLKDVEMAYTKRKLFSDLSGIASCSFEDFLMVSVPYTEILNRHTMVLDFAVANEFLGSANPAWAGVWTGTRPVEWDSAVITGKKNCFFASIDYFSLPGEETLNHIWQAFQPQGYDTYNIRQQIGDSWFDKTIKNPIYSSAETKLYGDGMDQKRFMYAEADLVELEGDVNMRISFGSTRGGYTEVFRRLMIATVEQGDNNSEKLEQILGVTALRPQSRRVKTQDFATTQGQCDEVESNYSLNIDKAFSLLFQWCGKAGIESFRIFMQPEPEPSTGACEEQETGIRLVTEAGTPLILEEE